VTLGPVVVVALLFPAVDVVTDIARFDITLLYTMYALPLPQKEWISRLNSIVLFQVDSSYNTENMV